MFEPPRRTARCHLSRGAAPAPPSSARPDPVERGAAARTRPTGRRVAGLAVAVTLVLLAGCSGAADTGSSGTTSTSALDAVLAPALEAGGTVPVPATLPIPDDLVAPDTRNVRIQPVLSKPRKAVDHTKPILAIEGGNATLHGRVFAPDDDVEGSLVRLERFVGEDFGVLDVPVRKDGTWEIKDIRGGRYRVRAFKKPHLATTEPQPYFLAADHGEGNVDLTMERHEGLLLQGAVDVPEAHVGLKMTLRVLLLVEEVADDGVVRGKGIPAAEVQMTLLGGVAVVGPVVTTTDENGFAGFTVLCTAEGVNAVDLSSSGLTTRVELPDCGPGEVDPSDLNPDGTDTFPVGSTFTVPRDEVIPPGTYKATSPGNCGTTFEAYVGSSWTNGLALERTIILQHPARKLRALIGSTPCSYERTA